MRRIVCLILACLLPGLCSCRRRAVQDKARLTVICLDVGQGDATLLQTAKGENVLIDTGPESAEENLASRLRSLGVEKISLLVLTHPDEDHIGGADRILNGFAVDRVWINGVWAENGEESYQRLLSALHRSSATVEKVAAGQAYVAEEFLLTVLYPLPDTEVLPGNDGSIVMRLQCGSVGMLFMGDAEETAERELLKTYPYGHLDVQILHAGHHGGDTSSTADFLDAVRPDTVLISCGEANRFGPPDGRTLARFRERDCKVYRTDRQGEITIRLDGENAAVSVREKREGE